MEYSSEWQLLGERVREARVASQLSQGDLADRIGLERTALVKIESGARRVSAMELFRLADSLTVPASYFVTPPRAAAVSRRTPLIDEPDQADRIRWRLDTALDAHGRDVEQLVGHGLLTAPAHGIPASGVTTPDAARQLARDARTAAGLGDEPIGQLAEQCEFFGLYLLVVDQDTDGASLLLDGPGGIGAAVIGGRADHGRRRWTAAHELGHHLMGDEYHADVGVHSARVERERLIDAFADELLLPAEGLRHYWHRRDGDDERSRLISIAADYRASWSAVIDAAHGAGLLDQPSTQRLRSDRPVKGDFIAVVGAEPVPDLPIGTTGARWRMAVVDGYRGGLITQARAVELLHGILSAAELPAVPDPAP